MDVTRMLTAIAVIVPIADSTFSVPNP